MATCSVCGKEISRGSTMCAEHRDRALRAQSLADTEARDREILDWVDGEGLNIGRVAERLSVSRTRASTLIRDARRREEQRREGAGAGA